MKTFLSTVLFQVTQLVYSSPRTWWCLCGSTPGSVSSARPAACVGQVRMMTSFCSVMTVTEDTTCTAWILPWRLLQRDRGVVIFVWKIFTSSSNSHRNDEFWNSFFMIRPLKRPQPYLFRSNSCNFAGLSEAQVNSKYFRSWFSRLDLFLMYKNEL